MADITIPWSKPKCSEIIGSSQSFAAHFKIAITYILACLLGGIIAVIISLIGFISDDTIKSQEDVEKRLGVSVLGIIPENDRIAMDK